MQREDEAERADAGDRSVDDLLSDVEELTGDEVGATSTGGTGAGTGTDSGSGSGATEATERRGDAADADRGRSGGLRERLPGFPSLPGRGGGRLFSPRSFLAVLLLSVAGLFLGSAVPVVGFLGQFVGLFAAAFAIGLVGSRRRYLEVGLAGAIAAGGGFVLSALTSIFPLFAARLLGEYGTAIAGVGVGAGLLVAVAGYYFGRDLRAGLTREV